MPSYYISGTGEFSYQTDAATPEEALDKFRAGELDFHDTMTVIYKDIEVEQVD